VIPKKLESPSIKMTLGRKVSSLNCRQTKGATYVIEQLPSSLKPESYSREAGKASFNSSPDHMSEPSEAETQTVGSTKPPKGGYVFRDIKLDAFKSRGSHKREGKS